MGAPKLQYLTDDKGQKVAVVLSIEQYNQIIEQLEELEDIKDYDQFKAQEDKQEFIPLDQAIKEIEDQSNDL